MGFEKNKILIIKIDKRSFDGHVTCQKLRFNYNFAKKANKEIKTWNEITSSGLYNNTNQLVNNLYEKFLYKNKFMHLILLREVNIFQFSTGYIYPYLWFATQIIETFDKLLEKNIPDILIYEKYNHNEFSKIWNKIIEEYALRYEIKLINKNNFIYKPKNALNNIKYFFKEYGIAYLVRSFKRFYPSMLGKNYYLRLLEDLKSNKKDIILLVTMGNRYWNDQFLKDYQFSEIINGISNLNEYNIVVVDLENCALNRLVERNRVLNINNQIWINYNIFITPWLYILRFFLKFPTRLYRYIILKRRIKKILIYKNISLFNSLLFTLKYIFFDISYEAEEYLYSSDKLLSIINPKYVVTTHEAAPIPRSLIIEASKRNIPTIGLQHGTLSGHHYDYCNKRVTINPLIDKYSFAVPRKTAVWGELWKDYLIRDGNYPKDSVVVTGNWRINFNDKFYEKKKQKFKDKSYLAVIPTVNHKFTYTFFKDILNLIQNYDNLIPIIKFHPSDSEDIENISLLTKLIKSYGYCEDVIFKGQINDLLFKSDIVIAEFSTVLFEAVIYKKPTILYNISRFQNYPKFCEDFDVIKVVDNAKDLKKGFFEELMRTDEIKYLKNREKFLKRIFYNEDNNALNRFLNLIKYPSNI